MQNPESFYKNYELRDIGDGRRLERFGQYLIDRPASQAQYSKKLDPFIWGRADFSFYNGIWHDSKDRELSKLSQVDLFSKGDHWHIGLNELSLKLGLLSNGQVGLFPEQIINWAWIHELISEHLKNKGAVSYSKDKKFTILNAFAYTGGASVFAADASKAFPSEICHLDGSRTSINWAGDNARLNSLSNIRWIEDDVLSFLRRELKRGKFYNAMILDPPAFGRAKGKTWSFKKDMQDLLDIAKELISPAGPLFFLLNSHDTGFNKDELKDLVASALSIPMRFMEAIELEIPCLRGNPLHCGVSVRFKKP
jgi:23S rRNA (cytosine1962-C5)-methyltransferase